MPLILVAIVMLFAKLTPSERSLRGQLAAHMSWANTPDPSARTEPARRGLEAKWLAEAGGDPVKAGHLRKAHYARMALASAKARRRKSELDGGGDHAA